MTPLFHFGSIKKMVPSKVQVADNCVEFLSRQKGKTLSWYYYSLPTKITLSKFIETFTMQAIIKVAFGDMFDTDWMSKRWVYVVYEFLNPCREYSELMNTALMFDTLIGFGLGRLLPVGSKIIRLRKEIIQEVTNTFEKLVERIKKSPEDEPADLLTVMASVDKPDLQTAIAEGLLFLFAGQDTTSKLLVHKNFGFKIKEWTFYYLAKYPTIQEKVYQEIRDVLGDKDLLSADLSKFIYTKHVIQETLRLRPPIPGTPVFICCQCS